MWKVSLNTLGQNLALTLFIKEVYTTDKFHIQWCLYPMLDLWNIINEWVKKKDKIMESKIELVLCVKLKKIYYYMQ